MRGAETWWVRVGSGEELFWVEIESVIERGAGAEMLWVGVGEEAETYWMGAEQLWYWKSTYKFIIHKMNWKLRRRKNGFKVRFKFTIKNIFLITLIIMIMCYIYSMGTPDRGFL